MQRFIGNTYGMMRSHAKEDNSELLPISYTRLRIEAKIHVG
jgi:hypothetical protein